MQYYNVHTHTFSTYDLPEDFLKLYLPSFIATPVDAITDTKVGSFIVRGLLSTLGGNGGRRYADFLHVGKSRTQKEVFEILMDSVADDPSMRQIALTLDMEHIGAGPSRTLFAGQVEDILNLKKEYDDNLLIFLGVDPRWKGTGTDIRKTVEGYFNTKLYVNELKQVNPFVGLKLYPSTGFYVFDEKLKETLQWAADNGVPVMSHCSYLGGVFNNVEKAIRNALNPRNVYDNGAVYSQAGYIKKNKFFRKLVNTNTSRNNLMTCSYFLEPSTYEYLFRYFERQFNEFERRNDPLKICMAHFGGGNQVEVAVLGTDGRKKPDQEELTPYGVTGTNWYRKIQELLTQYKGAYTDISYAVSNPDLFDAFHGDVNNPAYGDRVMFGTDFFMTERVRRHNEVYEAFKSFAVNKDLSNYPGTKLWDKVAGTNVERYLRSAYF